MTKATLEQARALYLTLQRVSGFLARLSDANPSDNSLLVTIAAPNDEAPEHEAYGDAVEGFGVLSTQAAPIALVSGELYAYPRQPQHPLVAELYAELGGWLLERLPALEAELKQEFDAL